jgi:hypothetical protein
MLDKDRFNLRGNKVCGFLEESVGLFEFFVFNE